MNLFLTQMVPNLRSADVRRDLADAYSMHRRIMCCFPYLADPGPGARNRLGVLYRVEMAPDQLRGRDRLTILIQSARPPDLAKLPPNYVSEQRAPKPFSLGLRQGQVLRFRLRANPARRLSRASKDKSGNPVPPEAVGKRVPIRDPDQRARWLASQGRHPAPAFSIVEVQPTWGTVGAGEHPAFELVDANTPVVHGKKCGHEITIEGALFEGLLRVDDPDALAQRVATGIGPGKAFGFGLLSLARS